ncbi:MAG: FAD-dependent monooxygenase, partial [Gammaproteobacteria bacterium]
MRQNYDLLIAGGGLAGNCLALALKDSGLRCAIVEAQTRLQQHDSPAGDRALALAAGTVNMMEALGIWQGTAQAATAIKNIHVSDQGHFGKTRLSAKNENVAALGYVITAREIETHVANLVDEAGIELISPARVTSIRTVAEAINIGLKRADESFSLSAKLLVGADGGMSTVRTLLDIPQQVSDYGQTALVTTVKSSLPNHNTAYERFTASGPLALLPVGAKHSAVVWTRSKEEAESLMKGSEQDFLSALQQCFGFKLGELTLVAPRRAFPLSLIRAGRMVSGR